MTIVDLPEAEERELNLALNSPELAGEFDDAKLATLLAQLKAQDATGFEALRLGEIDEGITAELDRNIVQQTAEQIVAEQQALAESQELSKAIAERLAAHLERLAQQQPDRLTKAVAIVIPLRRGHECLILADPNTHDAARELRRYADSGLASPIANLFAALLPMKHTPPDADNTGND